MVPILFYSRSWSIKHVSYKMNDCFPLLSTFLKECSLKFTLQNTKKEILESTIYSTQFMYSQSIMQDKDKAFSVNIST